MKGPIIAGVVVLVLALSFYFFYLIKSEPSADAKKSYATESEELDPRAILDLCFYKNLVNKRTGTLEEYRLNIYAIGNQVQGDLIMIPNDKAYKSGMFYGIFAQVDGERAVDVWWDAYEGDKNTKEELRIILSEAGTAKIGVGPMKDNGDGTFFYRNKNKLNYSLALEEINCR